MRRITALDGVRACAVTLVILGHSKLTWHAGHLSTVIALYIGNPSLGVEIFFVLSGFLITTLLLNEYDATGHIDLRAFYMRRVRRILPAFYLWLAVIAVLAAFHVIEVGWRDVVSAALFVRNYVPVPQEWWTGNAWTLCIEEWFYLGFPALVLLLSRRNLVRVLVAVAVLDPLVRFGQYALSHDGMAVTYQTHARFDTIALGCLLAIALRDARVRAWYTSSRAWAMSLAAFAIAFLVVPTLGAKLPLQFDNLIGYSLEGIGAALAIGYIVEHPQSVVSRFLSVRFAVWFGTISYSLYLWQQLFLTTMNPTPWPLNLLLAIACASASYYLVERPVLRLGRKSGAPPRDVSARAHGLTSPGTN